MTNFGLVNVLNLSLSLVTFMFTFVIGIFYVLYSKKIKDRYLFYSILSINVLLVIYSIFTFYIFYESGFFERIVYHLITFDHDFLAILTIIPSSIILIRGWRFIPKYVVTGYIFFVIVNGIFIYFSNYLFSIICIFFIVLFGSYLGIFAIKNKKNWKES